MKILLINYRYFLSGGPERYLFNISAELEKQGHQVIPFSTRHEKNKPCVYEKYFTSNLGGTTGIYFDEYKKNLKTIFQTIGRQFYSHTVKKDLSTLIKETRPDVCYLLHYINKLSPSVISACRENGIPIVHRLSDYYMICAESGMYNKHKFCNKCKKSNTAIFKNKCIKNSLPASILKYLAYTFYHKAGFFDQIDKLICTNQFMIDQLIEFGIEPERLSLNPTFFNEELWGEKPAIPGKKPKRKLHLVCIGNVDHSKGTYDLLEALTHIRGLHDKIDVIIAGCRLKKELAGITARVQQFKLENVVRIIPSLPTEELKKIYLEADLSIIPARIVENLPNVLLESLYFELPVIVPNLGSFKTTVNDSVAFIFEPYDPASLANTIKFAINNPDQIIKKRKHCRNFLKNLYSKETHLKQLISTFESLTAPKEIKKP